MQDAVVAHPALRSLTHSLPGAIVGARTSLEAKHTVDLLGLYAESLSPLFSKHGMAAYAPSDFSRPRNLRLREKSS